MPKTDWPAGDLNVTYQAAAASPVTEMGAISRTVTADRPIESTESADQGKEEAQRLSQYVKDQIHSTANRSDEES